MLEGLRIKILAKDMLTLGFVIGTNMIGYT